MKRKSQAQSRGDITRNITAGENSTVSQRFCLRLVEICLGYIDICCDLLEILGSKRNITAGKDVSSYLRFFWNFVWDLFRFKGSTKGDNFSAFLSCVKKTYIVQIVPLLEEKGQGRLYQWLC